MIACAAQASRLWKGIDDDFSEECLQNAQNSWKAIMAKQSNWNVNRGKYYSDPYFAPSEFGVNNIFGDTYVVDDAYWAACELYATTGDAAYYDFLKDYKNYNDPSGQDKAFSLTSCLRGGENDRSFGSFNWGNTAGLGTLSLYLSDKTSSADRKTIANSIQNIADQYLIQMSKEGMGIPYKSMTTEDYIGSDKPAFTGYEYGSNSFVINNAMVLAYAYDTDDSKYIYRNGAAEALDYIYGRNGLGFSYVSGYGDKAMKSPHHRYWANSIDPDFPKAPSGVLAGGPCSDMYHDNYLRGLGYKRGTLANQKYYADSAEAVSVYRVEPYVMAADVYDHPNLRGRGGWTWYTGSAGWMYNAILALLGYERKGDRVRLNALLGDWPMAAVTVQFGKSSYRLVSDRKAQSVSLDGNKIEKYYASYWWD